MRQRLSPASRWLTAASLLGLLGVAQPAQATVDSVISGAIADELLRPLAEVTVVLHDTRGQLVASVKSSASGSFEFHGVPFGEYNVEAKPSGRTEAHQHIQVGSSAAVHVELYCVQATEKEVIVEAREIGQPSRAVGSVTTLSRDSLNLLPQGDDRPLTEVVTTQAGFVPDAFGNVYARGNHANVQYQIDGIPIPDSVGSQFAQALPVRLVDSLEILSGGMPAEFGNRLAAVVSINTRHGTSVPEGLLQIRYGSFQTVESSGSYAQSIGRLSFFVGGSYLQSQRMLDPPAVTPILHDDGQSGRAFLRLDFAPRPRDRLELFANYGHSRFEIPLDPTAIPLDPSHPELVRPLDRYGNGAPAFVPRDTDATETEHELFVTLSWVHSFVQRGTLQIAPYYKLSSGVLAADAAHALGSQADFGATASDVDRRADHYGGVIHYSVLIGRHLLKAGIQSDGLRGTTRYTQYLRNDRAPDGGIDPNGGGSGVDSSAALLSGVYVQDRFDSGRLGLQFGLRGDWQHVALADGSSSDQLGLSPRLGVSLAILPELIGRAFIGVNFQPPAPLDAGNAARALGVVPVATPIPYDIQAETNIYGELGLATRLRKRLKLGAVGWGRYAWNQLDDVAIGSTNLIANYNFTHGRAVGVEATADLIVGDWLSAFANFSWLIAQGQGISSAKFLFRPEELQSDAWQTLDHAQSYTANAGLTLTHSGAAFTALAAYGSGLRTGPANDQSVPPHLRFDATLQYSFEMVPLRPRLAIDVLNLFDAHYAYRIANGFIGSSYAAPRSVFVRLALPLGSGGSR